MASRNAFQLHALLALLLLVACQGFPQDEVRALQTFKDGIYEDPRSFLSDWNALDGTPCDWNGVICSFARDHVVKINITSASLRGFIAPELSRIIYLQELRLHGNFLVGTIPRELAVLKYLRVLDLGSNQLSGSIPAEIGDLESLQQINLASNGLTGGVPPEIGKLKNLEELRLDRNKLRGSLAAGNSSSSTGTKGLSASLASTSPLCQASKLKVVDLSFNFFNGSMPSCFKILPSSSFQGNCFKVSVPKQRSSDQCVGGQSKTQSDKANLHTTTSPAAKKHKGSSRPKWLLALEIVTVTLVSSVLILALLTLLRGCSSNPSIVRPWKRLSNKMGSNAVYIDAEILKGITKFSRQELEVACEDFSNIIGSSRDSMVYKGIMKGGSEIAVISICVKEDFWTGYHHLYFQKEVADLARLNHDNVGKLLGYCEENSSFSRMLVFEYASNGTLYEHLHYGEGCQFSWSRRMRIALGIARGLKYLHTEINPPFTISELSSTAVYFTDDFSPKLIDLESWKSIFARSQKSSSSIGSSGSICLLPDAIGGRIVDIQGNIYAFGVILLELISGRLPYCEERGCLVDWAKDYIEMPEAMAYVVDPELKSFFKYEELQAVCEAVSLCINPNSAVRPSMAELCDMLESKIDASVTVEMKTDSSLAWAAELALC